ncbi:MAG: FMN-binding protein, partial [Spirochaetaceae bacterium]|nr:FMN-binding protein [Spirochaetaceae bacterium]
MKKLLFVMLAIFCVLPLFAKSYLECLGEAKKYEEQKRWCYALGSYYDALGTDELPENKVEAKENYNRLKNAIISGNPGFGSFNVFDFHDEWKNLLIDAEKYGSSICIYDITVGDLEQGELDYSTRSATYTAKVSYKLGDRYKKTIAIIEQGYNIAYKKDWTDLPEKWPLYSASSNHDDKYNINGALVYCRDIKINGVLSTYYLNAFYQLYSQNFWVHETAGLYDFKFNIVDENGKELIKGKRWLLDDGDRISISGISPEVMDLIDNGTAFINPEDCYLQYGKYSSEDDKGGRTFMKNFPEVRLSMDKMVFNCWNNKTDKIAENFFSAINYIDIASGTYIGTAKGRNGEVAVNVTVTGGKIASVVVTKHEETPGVADPAITGIPAAIVKAQSTKVDAISGATLTSDAIKNAVDNALGTPIRKNAAIKYTAGTYSGTGTGMNGPVVLDVTFSDSAITDIKVKSHKETGHVGDPAFDIMFADAKAANGSGIDVVSGATFTSMAIRSALNDAAQKAGATKMEDFKKNTVVHNPQAPID